MLLIHDNAWMGGNRFYYVGQGRLGLEKVGWGAIIMVVTWHVSTPALAAESPAHFGAAQARDSPLCHQTQTRPRQC